MIGLEFRSHARMDIAPRHCFIHFPLHINATEEFPASAHPSQTESGLFWMFSSTAMPFKSLDLLFFYKYFNIIIICLLKFF